MYKWLILLSMLSTGASLAAPAWTWVDANGQQHFSDRPVPGARQIELAGAQGFSRATVPPRAPQSSGQAAAAPVRSVPYTQFNVLSPSQQQTLWNIQGNLAVQVDLTPTLQAGHRLDAFLDGQRIPVQATGTQFTVPDVFRGLHTLQAVVVDSNGDEVLRSLAVTFMVQQTSIQNPNNPNAGRN
jgi:hypothetical protein